ncbi:MAG TPA: hypothetical protein PLF78_13405 [Caulobacter sp.]|nr:hypothetical protein [Caulobacter sp.]
MPRSIGRLAAALLASVVLTPGHAHALTKPEAAAAWVARAQSFIAVLEDPATNGGNILKRQHEACRGLTGERMKMGGYWPIWAAEGMASFCKSLDGFHGAITVKDPCGELKKAGGYFAKAKPFGDSEAVVPTAERMVRMIDVMRAGAREAGYRRC